jgi:autotransporter strand-loop-strand O-heptosyltransferase
MRILILVSHLSTGGMPQVALKRVESLIKEHDVYLIEYRQIAWSFVVQRNKIESILCDRFISLGNIWNDNESKRDKFIQIVNDINPDIIHMEEIPELFNYGDIRKEHVEWLYRSDRPYKIIETTHTSLFDVNQKRYFPDKFMFVSKYSQQEYSKFNIPSCVVEYPSEKLERNKSQSINKLKFDGEYFNVLNVGLFNKNKNQGYIFEIAKKLKDYKINFHFVGNLADNFSDYWRPLMETKSDNCFVYGERDDNELFYQASDLLIHSSVLELNPLAIKEATSYDLPILLNKLDTYLDMYDSYKNIKYLTMDVDKDSQYILDNFNIKRKDDNQTFKINLIEEYKNILNVNNQIINVNNNTLSETLIYNINFVDGARVEILGNKKADFDIEFFDKKTSELIYKTTIPTNNWCSTNAKYYKEYKIDISYKGQLLISHDFDLTDRNVLIQLDSKSIGDTLAWFPYVEEFRKKHNCKVYCTTFWNNWFVNQYPEIIFLEPGQGDTVDNLYAYYRIGWYQPVDSNRNPNDYKKIPLQKTSSDILGLEYKEIIPKIEIPEGVRPIEDKYVCIAQYSTANTKHWHYPCKNSDKGWQMMVDWLNAQGYKVMVISKQETKLKNVIDRTGNFPIEHRINELKWCEFFIGIGSGLSWLAWAIGKKVVMISGFSNPICEFKTNIINVHNFNVCNGCFNRHMFDRGDWNWCPEHKDTDRQFECSSNITPKMVVERMINSKLIEKPNYFDFDKYDETIVLDEKDIDINYEVETNKLIITYKNDVPTPKMNIDVKDFYKNKVYHVVSDISLDKNYIVWCVPNDKLNQTDKLIISFYEKSKILDLQFNL